MVAQQHWLLSVWFITVCLFSSVSKGCWNNATEAESSQCQERHQYEVAACHHHPHKITFWFPIPHVSIIIDLGTHVLLSQKAERCVTVRVFFSFLIFVSLLMKQTLGWMRIWPLFFTTVRRSKLSWSVFYNVNKSCKNSQTTPFAWKYLPTLYFCILFTSLSASNLNCNIIKCKPSVCTFCVFWLFQYICSRWKSV